MDYIKPANKIDILDFEAVREYAHERMSGKRYVHTLGVEQTCIQLAEAYLSGTEKDYLRSAALLHDITKELDYSGQLILAEKFGIMLKDADLSVPKSLHARTGAAVAREVFGAPDTVVHAINSHTTGAEDMDLFAKLLYIADCIEPGRTDEDCVSLRTFFRDRLAQAQTRRERLALADETVLASLDCTVLSLIKQKKPIHSDSVAARNRIIGGGLEQARQPL